MALRINTNIAAMNSYRNLSVTDDQMSKSLEKLSSGFRINRAADDAAGLAISEGLRSQVSGLKVATRNAQDGISVVQTAEGALSETHSILQRMRDLSVQASSDGGLNEDAKSAIQSEVTQLKSELTRIAETTKFNGKALLDGSYAGDFQVGANKGELIQVNLKDGKGAGAAGLGIAGIDVTKVAESAYAFEVTHAAAGTTPVASVLTVDVGDTADATAAATFQGVSGSITLGGKSLDLASVKYVATDGTAADTQAEGLAALNAALKATFGTEADGTTARVVASADGTDGLQFDIDAPAADASIEDVAAATLGYQPKTGAADAIEKITDAITAVSSTRSNLGALQNRFEHTINNLNVTTENLSASESRIRDADMAQEMVKFTRNQILSQAGTAMLAQANQSSQGVLSLLR